MRFPRLLAVPALVMVFLLSAAPFALAASGPTCFCSITGKGATATGGATDPKSCQTACGKLADSVDYSWAKDASEYPTALLTCFANAAMCEKDMNGDGSVDGKFDTLQPAECLPGAHYCYSTDTIKTTLIVAIPTPNGDYTQALNFGEYVGVIYNYLLGFALTATIVFMMIGGLRYVIGAGSGDIAKAKKMITNAVEGFVLLMFAYIILYTVNPQLIKL